MENLVLGFKQCIVPTLEPFKFSALLLFWQCSLKTNDRREVSSLRHLDLKHGRRPFCLGGGGHDLCNTQEGHVFFIQDRGVSSRSCWAMFIQWSVCAAAHSDVWMFASVRPQTGSIDRGFHCLAPFPAGPTFHSCTAVLPFTINVLFSTRKSSNQQGSINVWYRVYLHLWWLILFIRSVWL